MKLIFACVMNERQISKIDSNSVTSLPNKGKPEMCRRRADGVNWVTVFSGSTVDKSKTVTFERSKNEETRHTDNLCPQTEKEKASFPLSVLPCLLKIY